jgi:ribosome-associated protein
LIALAGNRIVADGVLLIDSRVFRSQAQNREAARARLMALVQKAMKAPKRRKATKPRPGAREERLTTKKKRSAVKQLRGRGGRGDE